MSYRAEVTRLLTRAQPGSRGGVQQHIARGAQQLERINKRFPAVKRPEQMRLKHLQWLRDYGLDDLAPATRYKHFLTASTIAAALDRWSDWETRLRGNWCHPKGDLARKKTGAGGRPRRMPGR